MGCSAASPVYWVGVVVLSLAFALSLAGLASPYWREFVHNTRRGNGDAHSYEGLWQCYAQKDDKTRCFGSEQSSGLWRVIQALEMVSIISLFCGWLGAVLCIKGAYRRATKGCHSCAAAAVVTGAVFGLAGDMAYVGHMEVYWRPLPADIPYSWSFALSVAGHISSVVAAVIILASVICCQPKYSSQKARPYLEDYDLKKLGSAPLQYIYTLPVYLGSEYQLGDGEYYPSKGNHHEKGTLPVKDYPQDLDTWSIRGDQCDKEKWVSKGHHHKKVYVNGARVMDDEVVRGGKMACSAVNQLDKTTSTEDHNISDSMDSGLGLHRSVNATRHYRSPAHKSDGASSMQDPLHIDAANHRHNKTKHSPRPHTPMTEDSFTQTDKAFPDPFSGERLIWRPKATPPMCNRPIKGQDVFIRQPHYYQEMPAWYTLPWRRFLWMPETRARNFGTERIVIKAGRETFVL